MERGGASLGLNREEMRGTSLGVVCAGVVYQFVREALPEASVLKLGLSYPLDRQAVRDFAAQVDKLVVIEELEGILEQEIAAMGIPVEGKKYTGRQGELSVQRIREAFGGEKAPQEPALPARPPVLCPGCPHRATFHVLKKLKLHVFGDIGCYTLCALPPVDIIAPEQLFDGDVFLFCASRMVPDTSVTSGDVRMAQYGLNRELAAIYARMAGEKNYRGLFCVVSDPVDPLCRAAMRESGLAPAQVRGFGLGVMHARALYYARRDGRFASYLTEGRAFGPHGEDLVLANSVAHYDDALSRELTDKVAHANLEMRRLGYKPYVAPALSSGALSLLALLRGQWHYSSVYDGQVFMGCRNRLTHAGIETETLTLPPALQKRLDETRAKLNAIE